MDFVKIFSEKTIPQPQQPSNLSGDPERIDGKGAERRPYAPPSGIPLVARPDLIACGFEVNSDNACILHEHFDEILDRLLFFFGGKTYCRPSHYFGKRTWSVTLHGGITNMRLSFPLFGQSFDPPHKGRGLCLEKIKTPFLPWGELYQSDCQQLFLGRIQLSDPTKLYFSEHLEDLGEIFDILESVFKLTLIPTRFEVAMDTLDESRGKALAQQANLKWADPKTLFHCPETKVKILGPSPDGFREYQNYRAKHRGDKRPASERPRGGLRQLVTYTKEFWGGEYPIYRTEIRFYYQFLKRYRRKHGIKSIRELIDRAPNMINRYLSMQILDLEMVYKMHPETRTLRLEEIFSVRGQKCILRNSGFSRKSLQAFITRLPTPNLFALDTSVFEHPYHIPEHHYESDVLVSLFPGNKSPDPVSSIIGARNERSILNKSPDPLDFLRSSADPKSAPLGRLERPCSCSESDALTMKDLFSMFQGRISLGTEKQMQKKAQAANAAKRHDRLGTANEERRGRLRI